MSECLKKIYSGELSKEIAAALKTKYPTKRVEISKINVMNPSSLMEVPPDDEELEKILTEAEEAPVEEIENAEDDVEAQSETKVEESEDIDYSSMKVAELKELLKQKDLPVSGTKAELIKRLQT